MEQVLIDSFVVPQASREAFLEQARRAQQFIRTVPGYVEGFIYEQQAGDSRCNVMTIVVWESAAALEQAKQAVAAEYQRRGYNPRESLAQLNVEMVRAVYERTAY